MPDDPHLPDCDEGVTQGKNCPECRRVLDGDLIAYAAKYGAAIGCVCNDG